MKGVRCEIISFGISTSNELIEAADQFTEITTLPGIFRNAPSGPGAHLRAPQVSEGRGLLTYSAVSYSASYGLPMERLSGEKERERMRATGERIQHPEYWAERVNNQSSPSEDVSSNALIAGEQLSQSAGYDFATHGEFMLPDTQPCEDIHSIPLERPSIEKQNNGRE